MVLALNWGHFAIIDMSSYLGFKWREYATQ